MNRLLNAVAGALCLALAGGGLAQAQKRIYIGPDDHTDLFWSGSLEQYREAFLRTLDHYIARAEADIGAGRPESLQSHWHADGSLWLWEYQRNRSAQDFQRLIDLIDSGHISVPLNPVVSADGGTPLEAVLRGMYYAGSIERRFGVDLELAAQQENQTLPLGLASLWAGAGVSYSWKGVCNCGSVVPNAGDRGREIYWYRGLDGQQVLLKWYSQDQSGVFPLEFSQGPGGYAEARRPAISVDYVTRSGTFQNRHPFETIGLFGYGWDDFETQVGPGQTDGAGKLVDFVAAAEALSNAERQVIVSSGEDFFRDFAARYGDQLAAQTVSYGNDWDLYSATLAEVSARLKRALEKLRAAEALAAVVSRAEPLFMAGRETARERAFFNFGLYWEHSFGMEFFDPGSAEVAARLAWQRRLVSEIESYVDRLYSDAAVRLGALIENPAQEPRIYVFNPLGWPRVGVADYRYDGDAAVQVVDLGSGQAVPSQVVQLDSGRYLRLQTSLPTLGYKVFALRPGIGMAGFGPAAQVDGNSIDNGVYRVTVNGRGALAGWTDNASGRELIRAVNGRLGNDLGIGSGSVVAENLGPVSATLTATVSGKLPRSARFTLFRASDRLEIENRLLAGFDQVHSWAFGFNIDGPDVWHEEVGAVIRARLAANGGHYSDRSNNSRYDWLTLNHFADLNGAGAGITLSNADLYFMRLGNSTVDQLDSATPQINVLAGGEVVGSGFGIRNQGGDRRFLQRFALRAHGGRAAGGGHAAAMRFALEHQNPPLVAAVGNGAAQTFFPATEFSLLDIDQPDMLLWALKPADDDGSRLVARLWNLAERPLTTRLRVPVGAVTGAMRLNHLESELQPLPTVGGALSVTLAGQALATYGLTVQLNDQFPPVDTLWRADFEQN